MSVLIVGALLLGLAPANWGSGGEPPVTIAPASRVTVDDSRRVASTEALIAFPRLEGAAVSARVDALSSGFVGADGSPDGLDGYGSADGESLNSLEAEAVHLTEDRWHLPLKMRPLSQLSPDAARFVAERGGSITAGVYVAQDDALYVTSPELALPMASVAKVVIMLAVMDRAEVEERRLSQWELEQLEPMVVWSDNEAATYLWDDLGGAYGVDAYLAKQGVTGIVTHPYAWGDSRASGPALAWLLGRMAFGDLVTPEHRDLALAYLEQAALAQTWGVATAALDDQPEGATVASKDGWYPADAGWRAGSVGLVLRGIGETVGSLPYSIAVLTAQNPLLDDGIATVDGLAARIYSALAPR